MLCCIIMSLVDFYIGDEADKPGYGLKVRVCIGVECG